MSILNKMTAEVISLLMATAVDYEKIFQKREVTERLKGLIMNFINWYNCIASHLLDCNVDCTHERRKRGRVG